jgi:outer membrane biosynthesis protein TonB
MKKITQIIARIRRHLGISVSAFLHFVLFIILLLNFPQCQRKAPPEVIISIDLLPIAKKTNIEKKEATKKTKEAQIIEKPKAAEEAKPEPIKEEVKKEVIPEVKPAPKIEKKKVEKKKEVKKDPPKPAPKAKATPKKEKPKAKPKVTAEDQLLKSLLADVAKSELKEQKESKGPTEVGDSLSLSVKDSIKKQIEGCWNPPAGNKDAARLKVLLNISFKQDGEVANVKIIDNNKYAGDDLYRAAADAAMRAVYKCSPLQDLPVDQYKTWQNLEFYFDPSDLIY